MPKLGSDAHKKTHSMKRRGDLSEGDPGKGIQGMLARKDRKGKGGVIIRIVEAIRMTDRS